jgi:branched-chain amino acid transport system ATP-binding protein
LSVWARRSRGTLQRKGTTSGGGLEVRGAKCGYAHTPVLSDINFQTKPGECCGVLGANGAGKTTLLRLITGTVKLWEGSVCFDGYELRKMSPWNRVRLGLAHVPEGRRVFGPMTVEENLKVAGLVCKAGEGELNEVYSIFPRLRERREQRGDTLSGGEQQMLAIGRALMTSPKLLLIDEMSAGLAPAMAEALTERLDEIRDRGIAMLLVEQNPYLIADMVNRVVLLERGRVSAEGRLDELGGAERIGEIYLGVQS